MAADEPFDTPHPPDEAWWSRELHRSEKLMDKFMSVLGLPPDWDRLEAEVDSLFDEASAERRADDESVNEPDQTDTLTLDDAPDDTDEATPPPGDDTPDPDEDPELNVNYPAIALMAREFACGVFELDDAPDQAELLFLSAGKVGANLAGGHGLGYDDEFICGNIVKCRWALSDCEFCREMLELWHQRTGDEAYATLAAESRRMADAIRERIAALQQRVWW